MFGTRIRNPKASSPIIFVGFYGSTFHFLTIKTKWATLYSYYLILYCVQCINPYPANVENMVS